jgi:uncharacterized protein with FMN-binding domain
VLDLVKRTRISLVLLIVVVGLSVYFWLSIPGVISDGVYTASTDSFGGPLTVAVTIVGGEIAEIEVVEHNDTPFVAAGAISRVIPAIIEAQSPDVDVYSGATVTSNAIKEAVRQVLTDNR